MTAGTRVRSILAGADDLPRARGDSLDTFEQGDKVRLKSGGPTMTISSRAVGSGNRYVCQWFEGHTMEHRVFPVDDLELVAAAPPRR